MFHFIDAILAKKLFSKAWPISLSTLLINKLFNAVQENYRSLLWDSYRSHKFDLWKETIKCFNAKRIMHSVTSSPERVKLTYLKYLVKVCKFL